MGSALSLLSGYTDETQVPPLTKDAVQSILERTPTTTLLTRAMKISRVWRQLGIRNVIWLPRLNKLTGQDYKLEDFVPGQVYTLFIREWTKYAHVWLDQDIILRASYWTHALVDVQVVVLDYDTRMQLAFNMTERFTWTEPNDPWIKHYFEPHAQEPSWHILQENANVAITPQHTAIPVQGRFLPIRTCLIIRSNNTFIAYNVNHEGGPLVRVPVLGHTSTYDLLGDAVFKCPV